MKGDPRSLDYGTDEASVFMVVYLAVLMGL